MQRLQLARQANKGYLGFFGDYKSQNRAHKSTLELDLVATFDSVLERASSLRTGNSRVLGPILRHQLFHNTVKGLASCAECTVRALDLHSLYQHQVTDSGVTAAGPAHLLLLSEPNSVYVLSGELQASLSAVQPQDLAQ